MTNKDEISDLPIIHFSTDFLEGDYGLGLDDRSDLNVPMPMFRQFYDLRNSVLRACRRFGSVGAAGDYQWDEEEAGPYLAESEIVGDSDPEFFVVDEMWNPIDKYIKVEPTSSHLINFGLLSSLVEAVRSYPGWAVGVYLEDCCVLVFAEKLMVKGPRFKNSFTVLSVIAACSA